MDNAEFGVVPLLRRSKPYGAIVAAIFIIATAFLYYRFDVTAAFTCSTAFGLLLAGGAYCVWFFFQSNTQTRFGVASPKLGLAVAGCSVFGSVVLEAATVFGSPASSVFRLEDWSKKELVIYFVLCMAIAMLALVRQRKETDVLPEHTSALLSLRSAVTTLPGCLAAILILNLAVAGIIFLAFGNTFAPTQRLIYLACCLLIAAIFCCLYAKWAPGHPEYFFVSIGLSLGLFLCVALPPLTAISLDDQIHYVRSLGLSYLGEAQYSPQETELFKVPWVEDGALQFDEINDKVASADIDYKREVATGEIMETPGFRAAVTAESLLNISTIGYAPSAVGLWLARLLHIPLLHGVVCGKIANLLSYIAVVALAIRISPIKKMLMSLIGLLPTSLYLAANYSYDPWVTSFLMLAVALVLRECSKPDERFSFFDFLLIAFVFGIGLAPKAVYCPLIGLMFLIPSSRFKNKQEHRNYIGWVIALGLFMALSFALPMLFSSAAQTGDVRGGEGVNAIGQVGYILSHPIEYAKTLTFFILTYISPVASDAYSVTYTYMGSLVAVLPMFSAFPFALLMSTAFSERNEDNLIYVSCAGKIWAAFVVILSIALVSTALYVSFTPVGSTGIAGVQGRYLLPLLYPFLACVCCSEEKMGVRAYKDVKTVGIFALSAMSFLSVIMNVLLVVPW